jgi:hypothetical protein
MLPLRALALVSLLTPLACSACSRDAPGPRTWQAAIGPWPIEPGQEKTECIVYHLGNPEGGFIRHIHAELGPRSHHMSLYASAATEEQRVPFACRGFDSILEGDRPLFIAQQERADLTFPDDDQGAPVGFQIGPDQMLRLELHYLDTTGTPGTGEGHFVLDTIPVSTAVVPADIGFWGTTDFQIPPHAAAETPVKFVRAMPDSHIFAVTTHQHHLGTRMRVWYANDANDTASTPICDCRTWSDPPIEIMSPPLSFGPGAKAGLAYQCQWMNNGPDPVVYGEGFDNEMCFLWQYYFPGRGFDHIVQP